MGPPTRILKTLMLLALLGPACAGAQEDGEIDFTRFPGDEEAIPEIAAPLEPLNRLVFRINDRVYFYALKPAARALRTIPEPARVSVENFFYNLSTPIRFTSALLQGKIVDAGNEFGRFMINSTFGIGGLFDFAATHADLHRKDEDFGQVLGHYGVGHGFYLVLPVLGPSSLRDAFGLAVDYELDATNGILGLETYREALIQRTVENINTLSLDKDTYEAVVAEALDPYLFSRDAYVQLRAGQVRR